MRPFGGQCLCALFSDVRILATQRLHIAHQMLSEAQSAHVTCVKGSKVKLLFFLPTLELHCIDPKLLAGHYSETESHRASGVAGMYFVVGVGVEV